MKFGIGQSAARVEDRQLLVGAGCFSDDVAPGQGLRIAFLRSPHAHARICTPDVSAARKLAGVRLVATQADLDADNIGDIECQFCPPLIGGGKTKFAPIYVGDVAKAIVKALELNNSEPKIYELGGSKNYSFKELMEILLTEIKKKRFLIPVPFGMAKFQSYFLQMMPNPLLTPDQVEMLKYNNIVSGDYPTLQDLGISGTSIQSILPKYIYRFRTGGQFG